MKLFTRHTFPVDAWLKLTTDLRSPDIRVEVNRVVRLPDRSLLVFTYPSPTKLDEEALSNGFALDEPNDFFAGVEPTIKRVTIDPREGGSLVAVEFVVFADSAVYREETSTLYVCAPLLD